VRLLGVAVLLLLPETFVDGLVYVVDLLNVDLLALLDVLYDE